MQTPTAVHPDIEAVAFLVGRWTGRGYGTFPTIEPFSYLEEVTFSSAGSPLLAYTQRTWSDGTTRRPLHAESGYLRGRPGDELELVVAHATGITEVATGAVRRQPQHHPQRAGSAPPGSGVTGENAAAAETVVLELRSVQLGRTPSAKEVSTITRRVVFDGERLAYELAMAAVGQPLTIHLQGELRRVVATTERSPG